jgi:cell division protein FtsB
MIQVNLLPPEYRAAAGTPVARFVAIVAGVVLVIGASCAFAYTHFIQLAKVREVKSLREEEAASKEIQKERSLALQREIGEYEERRRAIQTINRNRVLWSRKLDQFFDIVAGRDSSYSAWLDELEVPTLLATNRRATAGVGGGVPDGGLFKFTGFLAMNGANEAPAQNSSFYRALTGDPDTTKQSNEFFTDFTSISNPAIDIVNSSSSAGEQLTPAVVGAIRYELHLRAPAIEGAVKPKAGN